MNKPKLLVAAASRVFLNVCVVFVLVVLASLIGVGGAALWIYSRPVAVATDAKHGSLRLKPDIAATEERSFPKLTSIQTDDDTPAQLTPAHYVPADSEIATFSGAPRYTYVSYNGGRQQAHLRVNMVAAEAAPAPLADATPVQSGGRPPLFDSGSRYITNAQGQVIGVDGTASSQQFAVARALPVQTVGTTPEVRVAAPVVTRKALPVEDGALSDSTTSSFDVQAELAHEDDRPVLRAQPVARSAGNIRPTMFGARDDIRSFARD